MAEQVKDEEFKSRRRKSTVSTENHSEEELDIHELFLILKEHRIFVAIVILCCLLVASIYCLRIPPRYETSALIQVNNKSEGMGGMLEGLDSSISAAMGRTTGASPAQIESALIGSRFILEPTINKLGLDIHVTPHYFPIFGFYLAQHYEDDGIAKPLFGMTKYAWGGEVINVKQFKIPDNLTKKIFKIVTLTDGNYKLYDDSKKLLLVGHVGQLAQYDDLHNHTYVRILVSDLKACVGTEFKIYATQLSDTLKELSESIRIVDLGSQGADLLGRSQTGILNIAMRGTNAEELSNVLNTIVYLDIEKNSSKKTIEAQKTLEFLDQQVIILKDDLNQAATALSEYQATKGAIGMNIEREVLLQKVVEVEKALGEIKLKKVEFLQEYTELHPYLISMKNKQNQLEKELEILYVTVKTLPATQQKILGLERDVKVKSQLYLLLLNKIQQLQIIKAGTISDVRILNAAATPIKLPSRKPIVLVGGAFFGFILAVLILFLRRLADKGMNDPDYLEEQLGIPLYAVIPHSKQQETLTQKMKRKVPGAGPFVLAAADQKDLAIEGLRSLRTTLQFALQEVKNNVVAIMGSSPSIGKSFVGLNLAYLFVDTGKKVLLIDADMRKGKICQYLSLPSSPGLADILMQTVTFENAKNTIKPDALDFVATGNYPVNPAELLTGNVFKDFLEAIKQQYDIIIIDTPPILAVTVAILIARHTGINLLLLGSSSEHIRSLIHSVRRVEKNDITIHGLIFNNTKGAKYSGGYYGKNYGYYYCDYNNENNSEKKKS